MSPLRYILPALAAAGSAYAACSANPTATIQNQGDASAVATCRTFTGSIAIATNAAGDLDFGTLGEVSDDFVAEKAPNLTKIAAGSLSKIGKKFGLNDIQILTSVNVPQLKEVGSIEWNALPNLNSLTANVRKATKVDIQNTNLNTLEGIALDNIDTIYLANNNYLEKVELQLANISTSLTLEANSAKLTASFPKLEWAYNMTFRNCASVAIPILKSVNGSLGFYSNNFQSIEGPNLTTIGGSLSFVSNTELGNISLPQLTTVNGGFQIANNTKVTEVNGFQKLKTVGGALDFFGNFTSVDLPTLGDVRGAFNLQSSGDISKTCDHFKPLAGSNNVIKGKYQCAGALSNPGDASKTPTASGSQTSTKPNAAGMVVSSPAMMGVTGLLAAMLGLL